MTSRGKYDYDFSNRVILVVEDNHISFKLVSAVLSQVQATVVHASDGRQAIELCGSDAHFDLVLMDMQLPEVNGLDATREIKRMRPDLVVVATTANAYAEDEIACRKAGCDAFISKPLNFKNMFELMQSVFDA
ncbi:MAG: response regulator [Bacteroidota bacterium]